MAPEPPRPASAVGGDDHPWAAEHRLTPAIAKAAIAAQFPDIDVGVVEHIGSGWEFDAYRTGDAWVFRFPRRAEYENSFEVEAPALELARAALPGAIETPLVERIGSPGPDFPYRFAGHRWLRGVPADHAGVTATDALATDIGRALGAIHRVPVERALRAGVARDPDGPLEWLRVAQEAAHRVRGMDPTIDPALDWVSAGPVPPPAVEDSERFIHNDLFSDHLLVDPATGRLLGILDWTDASIGEATLDFVVLAAWRGERFLERVLAAYLGDGPEVSSRAAFLDRIVFLARIMSIDWLSDAHLQGGDVAKQVRWVANAFSFDDVGA